ncbi:MAG: helix-turn-helix domain-containing protein [Sphingorhabdus sp.]
MDNKQLESLTERQKDCLRLVGKGFTSKEIALELDLAPSTVDNHIGSAVQMLQASNRGMAARALEDFELRQKLPRQSPKLADRSKMDDKNPNREAEDGASPAAIFFTLPSLGGKRNDLDGASRSLRILQVAVVAVAVSIALTILIAGLFKTFS